MKILFINSINPYKGAGIFAKIFAKEMMRQGNQIRLITRDWDKFEDDFVVSYHTKCHTRFVRAKIDLIRGTKNLIKRIFPRLVQFYKARQGESKINEIYDFMDIDHTSSCISIDQFVRRVDFTPDVIFIFFAFHFLTEEDIYHIDKVYGGVPVFLCMPDSATITGGCHQVFDCKGYVTGCGNCPALYSSDPEDQSRKNFLSKQKYYAMMDITKVYGSLHQERQLAQSLLFKDRPWSKSIGGVGLKVCELSNDVCREKYGLPKDKFILLFGAQSVSTYRKGLSYLIEALDLLLVRGVGVDNFHLALLGAYSQELDNQLSFPHTFLGFLPFDELPIVFAAVDIFLNPSIEDAGPMMINQSVMCGIPVVAFDMGVAKDLVLSGKSGYVARLKDAADFADGIESIYVMSSEQRENLRRTTREIGIEQCSLDKQIKKLTDAFQKAIDKGNDRQ